MSESVGAAPASQPPSGLKRVLVFPGGTEVGLEIWRSLRWHRQVELYSAGAPVSNHAPYVFARHFEVPMVTDPRWFPILKEIVERERIDFIFPGHDDIVEALAQHRDDLRALVVTSPTETCETCRYKSRTYDALSGVVPIPRRYSAAAEVDAFPVFARPDRGQGSQDAHLVADASELEALLLRAPGRYIVTEYLPGEEFTVDCLTDREGRLIYCAGRRRIRVRNGISVDTVTVDNPTFQEYATAINRRLRLRGGWFFQVKFSKQGTLTLLEVAPRIAGAMALDRVRGVNIALLSLFIVQGMDVEVLPNPMPVEMDRALTNRYRFDLRFTRAYLDLDDSLIVRGQVNTELVQFLFQCVNRGVRLTLLTRHAGDPLETLRRFRLAGVFDEIRTVPAGTPKSSAIDQTRDAIFIDDSFAERREVARATGLPTFDSSMVELLLDDRS
jgi:hypothetical protein